jgi:hypothetical protein
MTGLAIIAYVAPPVCSLPNVRSGRENRRQHLQRSFRVRRAVIREQDQGQVMQASMNNRFRGTGIHNDSGYTL